MCAYFASIFPVIGITLVGAQIRAVRWTYLPSVFLFYGFLLIILWFVLYKLQSDKVRITLLLALFLLTGIYTYNTNENSWKTYNYN